MRTSMIQNMTSLVPVKK